MYLKVPLWCYRASVERAVKQRNALKLCVPRQIPLNSLNKRMEKKPYVLEFFSATVRLWQAGRSTKARTALSAQQSLELTLGGESEESFVP